MGVTVTKSKREVVAHARGGFVLQRFLASPLSLLRDGRKFDVRIVVLLRSAQAPFEIYAHNKVFIRAANKSFNEKNLKDPEVSLTAMHLLSKEANHPKVDDDFFESLYDKNIFDNFIKKAHKAIASVFRAAAQKYPGFANSKNARAIYGTDFLIDNSGDPRLLEVTFDPTFLAVHEAMPDQDPQFADDCFNCLFFGEMNRITRLF